MSIIESAPLNALSESDVAKIRAHTQSCPECLRAFEAAQLSALLLRERAAVEAEPSPFFQTRVLAALRERQAQGAGLSFKRLWKATGALVSTMAAGVAALALLTIFAPGPQPTVGPQSQQAYSAYSAERVIFEREALPEDQMSYGQVLATLYEPEEDR
ncbi:MAG TPA: hypothetical protein VF544_17395 [Pyrinomonadaceae bacterium]